MPRELPVIYFKSTREWEKWLAQNGAASTGIWMKLFKKGSGQTSITYAEALDSALCYGWIDGLKNKFDEKAWVQKFTPRRPQSGWSKNNTEHAARLIKAGRMKPAGLKEINSAKADGRWEKAYHPQSTAVFPADFLKEVSKNKKAKVFLATLNSVNRYAIIYRLQTAKKPETREKRMTQFVAMLAKGEKLHP